MALNLDGTPNWPITLLIILSAILFWGFVGWVIVKLFRAFNLRAKMALDQRYLGLTIHVKPEPGDISLTYHTYSGCLVWFTQSTHQVFAPPSDASELLNRLFKYNMVWGWWSYGGLIIPILAYLNFLAQKRSIAAQIRSLDSESNRSGRR